MSKLKQYVGLDVSLKETSVAVIGENDRLAWRGSRLNPRGYCRRLEKACRARRAHRP